MRPLHLRVSGHAHSRTVNSRYITKPAISPSTLHTPSLEIIHSCDLTVRHSLKKRKIPSLPQPVHEMGIKEF